MKKRILFPVLFILLLTILSGCEVLGGIFEAGAWTGIIIVVGVVALILYLVSRMRK